MAAVTGGVGGDGGEDVVSRVSSPRGRAPGSSVARRDRRTVCVRDPFGKFCLSTMRTRRSEAGSTNERGAMTSGAALVNLTGAAHDETALNNTVASKRERAEIIFGPIENQPRNRLRIQEGRLLGTNGVVATWPTR